MHAVAYPPAPPDPPSDPPQEEIRPISFDDATDLVATNDDVDSIANMDEAEFKNTMDAELEATFIGGSNAPMDHVTPPSLGDQLGITDG